MSPPSPAPKPGWPPARIVLVAETARWPGWESAPVDASHRLAREPDLERAVECAIAEDLDVLLLDAEAPGLGAAAAADILRRLGRTVRLVAVGGQPDPAAFDECLHEPPGADALASLVARARDRGPAADDFEAAQEAALAEAVRSLRADFEATLAPLADALRAALSAGDAAALRLPCHRLRGSAAQFGEPELGALAGRAEDALAAGDAPLARAVARDLLARLAAGSPATEAPR